MLHIFLWNHDQPSHREYVPMVVNAMPGSGLLIFDSCNSHLTSAVKDLLYTNGIALAVIPRGMTLTLQFLDLYLDLYFFAYFKRPYDRRAMMTKCVPFAWKRRLTNCP